MKIVTIVGARPQFIKAAVVSRAINEHGGNLSEIIIHTGQHYDSNMSEVFFDELNIPKPTYNLGVGGGTHGKNTGRMIEGIEEVILSERPDWVLVYGDTDSTLAGALAAAKLHIPVAHVEAGLRSYNRLMPEEINRVLTDHVSSMLFVPGDSALNNLKKEGIIGDKVKVVGDVMYDAAIYYKNKSRKPNGLDFISFPERNFSLCTIHRAENTDNVDKLRNIMIGLSCIPGWVVLPLHPRTRSRLINSGIVPSKNIIIIDPVGYLEMVWLEANCSVVLTDSGGVQKEAYFHGKYCITMREETEWVELVDIGVNKIVGCSAEKMVEAYHEFSKFDANNMTEVYGDGFSAQKIISLIGH